MFLLSIIALVPHMDPPVPLSDKTCSLLNCEFESDQTECVERLSESNWRRSEEPTGNLHTGIRSLKNGAFIYSKGRSNDDLEKANSNQEDIKNTKPTIESTADNNEPYRRKKREILIDKRQNEFQLSDFSTNLIAKEENKPKETSEEIQQQDEKLQKLIETENAKIDEVEGISARLHFGDFELPRQLILEFCVYMASERSRLVLESELGGYCRSRYTIGFYKFE